MKMGIQYVLSCSTVHVNLSVGFLFILLLIKLYINQNYIIILKCNINEITYLKLLYNNTIIHLLKQDNKKYNWHINKKNTDGLVNRLASNLVILNNQIW